MRKFTQNIFSFASEMMTHDGKGRFSGIPPWLYLVILGIITFFAHPIFVPSDLKVYSCNALNIYLGKGYVDIDGSPVLFRPPLFSLMLALSYWLFGVSHESSFWVIKAFCILNPILIYAIGKRFFGIRVGISAALLVLASYTINVISFWHLDAVWPFFVLLSTLFFYLGFEENRTKYFLFAGLGLALAYLVKNVAILFFPMPFLMFFLINNYRRKSFLPKVLLSSTATFIVILPWLVYLLLHNHAPGLNLVIGGAGSGVLGSIANPSEFVNTQNLPLIFLSKLKSWCIGLWHYYHGSLFALDNWFNIAPLFIIAWCFVLLGAIRGNNHLRILILHILLFFPIIYLQGARNMRLGQTLIVYLLSYLALATFIESIVKVVSRKALKDSKVMSMIFVVTITCLIMGQIFINSKKDPGSKEFFKKNLLYKIVFGDKNGDKNYGNIVLADDNNFLDLIKKFSTPPNKLYMAITNRSLAKESYFNLKGSNKIHYLESQIRKSCKDEKSPHSEEQPIYLKVKRRTGSSQHSLKAVYKSQIVQMIEKENITHVLVESFNRETGGNRGLDRYFSAWPAFEKIPMAFEEFSIYKIISNAATSPSLPPIMDIETLGVLRAISSEKSRKNSGFLKSCFKTLFPSDECRLLEDSRPDLVHVSGEMRREASSMNETGGDYFDNGAYEQAIDLFKQAICLNPELGDAYGNLFFAVAILERQKVISMNPDNPIGYYHYAIFLDAHGLLDVAMINVQKAINLDPSHAKAYVTLGSLYAKQNRHYRAIDAFQQAVKVYKEFSGPRKEIIIRNSYTLIGDSCIQLGDPLKARMFYEKAIGIIPDPITYFKLGGLFLNLKDYHLAIKNLQQAVRLKPDFAQAYYALCYSHILLGDRETALEQYKKLKKIDQSLADRLNRESGLTME